MTNYRKMALIELTVLLLILGGIILYLLFNGSMLENMSFLTGK